MQREVKHFSLPFWLLGGAGEERAILALLFTGVKVSQDKYTESLTSSFPGVTKLESIHGIHSRTLSPCFRAMLLRNVLKQPPHSWSPPPGDKKEKWVVVNQKRLGHLFYPKNCLEIRTFCKLASTVVIRTYKMLATFRNTMSRSLCSDLSQILRILEFVPCDCCYLYYNFLTLLSEYSYLPIIAKIWVKNWVEWHVLISA